MSSLVKNGLTLITLIIIGGIGYYLFVLRDDSNVLLNSGEVSEARLASDQFLRQLDEIKNVDLSDEFFVDERFRSLVDFTKPVSPQPIGRANPFAPVE